MNFQKLNNIVGWSVFGLATIVYTLTVEQTASFWDCGEFIAVSFKLMVSHPPGAPFFMLVARIFSFLALGDVEKVAYWINMVSVLSSSFTILFLFWTIVLLARKFIKLENGEGFDKSQVILVLGAAAVGALVYTFSDSFWFSAVEAEVYAMSSFFTAFVFWAILKWEIMEDESQANRWLILIAYMMGLSIGVHLLNLVTVPALGLIYYFKKYTPSKWGVIFSIVISGLIIILINNIIIPGFPSMAGHFEIFFVNNVGLPFGSGVLVFGLIIIGLLAWGVMYAQKNQIVLLNTGLLALAFILIGYSSYSIIVIRSNFDPPIDENNPEDVMSFVRFLKREQYGSRPLLHGQYFTAKVIGTEEGAAVYTKGEDKYEITDRKISYKYDPAQTTILPRIYSTDPNHQRRYREILGLREGEVPSFGDNIRYLFKHQLGTMYLRYFMWNFSGRESDEQGAHWLMPWDALEDVPEELAQNQGRNNFFMIPLILGLIGMVFHYFRHLKDFAVVAMLFFLTGAALILYLNGPPTEPRERDYIYVGSYYAFAIWIGFAVFAIMEGLQKILKNANSAAWGSVVICLTAPIVMAQQGWDDHNRSNRYFSADSAKNFLASCAPNAILFTGGDNDTFPLWYVQNVEDFRSDIRVLVLSYSNTDWYINQMMARQYTSDPLPFTLTRNNYQQGGPNDYLPYEDLGIKMIDLKQYINAIRDNNKQLRVYKQANVVPSRTFSLKVDTTKVRKMGLIPQGMDSLLVDRMVFKLKRGRNALEKKDLMILDLLATNDWERPVYINNTSMQQISFDLTPYAVQQGQAYRILPVRRPAGQRDFVDSETMYDNMMNNFFYRELDNPNVYYTEDYRNFVLNHRSSFNTLAQRLIEEGKEEKARKSILFMLEKMPDEAISYDFTIATTAEILFKLNENDRALEIAGVLGDRAMEMANYLVDKRETGGRSFQLSMAILGELQYTLKEFGEDELAKKYEDSYNQFLTDAQVFGRGRL